MNHMSQTFFLIIGKVVQFQDTYILEQLILRPNVHMGTLIKEPQTERHKNRRGLAGKKEDKEFSRKG